MKEGGELRQKKRKSRSEQANDEEEIIHTDTINEKQKKTKSKSTKCNICVIFDSFVEQT